MEPTTQDPARQYSPDNPYAAKRQYSPDNPYAPENANADNAHTSPGVESRFDNVLTNPRPIPTPTPEPWMVGRLRQSPQRAVTLTPAEPQEAPVASPKGYDVVNTSHADAAGHVPTHRVDQPTNKLPGESWEQYESRVLARTSFSPDTAARSDTGSLEPDVRTSAESLLAAAKAEGVNLSVGETRRTQERQEMLFQKGRSKPGTPVTWTLTSNHTPGRALDLNGDPSAYAWLQANAPKFGFSTMGDMDPGHVAIPAPAQSAKSTTLPTPKLVADVLPHENVPVTSHPLPEPFRSLSDFIVQPAMDNPLTTAAFFTPPGAIIGTAQIPIHAAQYAGQKAAELSLPPDVRAMAEKDPQRIPGRQIATELGTAALAGALHAGFKGPPIAEGMMEAGVKGAAAESHAQLRTNYTRDAVSEKLPPISDTKQPAPPTEVPRAPTVEAKAPESVPTALPKPTEYSKDNPFVTTNFDKETEQALGHGRQTRVLLGDGQKLPARYRLMPADELQSSHDPFNFNPNPKYPEGVQGRDYQRNKPAQEAMAARALQYDADRALNPSESAGEGAPTVLPDGTVIAGNERSILPRRAMQQAPQRYAAYVEQLKSRASEFGIDPAHVDQIKNPILVRELTDPADIGGGPRRWSQINQLSDEATTKAKSATEEGAARSAKLMGATDALSHLTQTLPPESTVSEYLGTNDGRVFVRRLVEDGVISREDVARLSDGQGTLTEDGRTAVRRMLTGAAVTDPAVLSDAPAGVVNKLEHAVPAIITTRGTKFDISRLTTEALRMLAEARANKMTVGDLLAQAGMFGDAKYPEVVAHMASALDQMKPTEVKAAYRQYAVLAREAIAGDGNMFGASEFDTPRKAFDKAFRAENAARDEGFFSPRPEMRGGIDAEEMAQRAKAGETRRAVRELTGREPEPTSQDFTQEEMFGPEAARAPSPEPETFETNFDDQLSLLSPTAARGAVDAAPRPAPTMDTEGVGKQSLIDTIRARIGRTKDPTMVPLIDISRKMAKALDVPLHQERAKLKQRSALGVFYPWSESVRVRRFDGVGTVAHEIGHYFSKRWLGNPTMRKGWFRGGPNPHFGTLPVDAVRELVRMGKDLYGTRKAAGGYGEEGAAEYWKFYVTDHASLVEKAPSFHRFVQENVFPKDPELKSILDWGRARFEQYMAGTPEERAGALLSIGERDKPAWNGRRLVSQYVDRVSEFARATREIEKQRGTAVDAEKDAGTLARLAAGAGGIAEDMLHHGVVAYGTTTRLTKGLGDIIDSVPREQRADWRAYLLAHRTLEKRAQGVNTGMTAADARALVAKGDQMPKWREAAEDIWKVSHALLDYRRDGGLLTTSEAAHIKELNQKRVPLYREFDADEKSTLRGGSGAPQGKNTSGLFKMRGSARRVIDPFEGLVQDIYDTTRQVAQHQPVQELVKLAHNTEGGARIAEIVPTPKERLALTTEEVKRQLRDLGFAPPDYDPDIESLDEAWQNAMDDHLPGILEGFRDINSERASERKDMVVSVIIDGKRKLVQLPDRQLYEAVKGLSDPQYNMLTSLMGHFTRALRAGATLTPDFAVGNVVRDMQTAATFSRSKRLLPVPGEHLARGLFHLFGKTDLYHEFMLSGGDQAGIMERSRSAPQKILRDLEATPSEKAVGLVRHPIETLRMVSGIAETATRLGEMAISRAEGHGPRESAFNAREVTQDFAKSGTIVRALNQIIPFESARVGGASKLVAELRERPQVIIPRLLAYTTLPSIALYLAQKDDPDYRAVPEWQHALAHIIVERSGDGTVKHIWRIPRAPGLGQLFGYVPIQVMKYVESKDPRALRKAWDALSSEFNPAQWPTAIQPVIEAIYNHSMFRDRPLVPKAREGLEPSEQFAPHTGEFSRQVGRWTNTSPAKLENFATGYGGGLAQYGLGAADEATRAIREANDLPALTQRRAASEDIANDIPIAKRFTVRRPGTDAESVQQFYEEYDDAVMKYDTWNRMRKEGRKAEAADFLREHRRQIEAVAPSSERGDGNTGPLRAAATLMSKIQQAARGGRLDETTTGAKIRAIAESPGVTRAFRHPITRP